MRSCPTDYEFKEAMDLNQALTALGSGESWRPFAGGTDLMVLFNAGILPHRRLLSISKISELSQISTSPEWVTIGASCTYASILRSEAIQKEFPLLCQSASWTGSVANQNRGTLGGNIANGSPAADSPPALLVYNSELEIASAKGHRRIPYADFHTGYKQMRLGADELIVAIHLPRTNFKLAQYARKVGSRKAQAISKVCFHGVANLESNRIIDIRLAVGSVAAFPLRCRKLETFLVGQPMTKSLIQAARTKLLEEIHPIDDIRSTAAYRSQVSQNLLGEFLEQLL